MHQTTTYGEPLMTEQLDKINQKINEMMAKGDFGTPADPSLISQTWMRLTQELVDQIQGGKPTYNQITGLWYQGDRGKVAYTGRAQEEITIPADAKILVFRQDKAQDNHPDMSVVYVTYDSE